MNKNNTFKIVIVVLASFLLSTCVSLWSMTTLSRDHIRDINTMIAARINIAIDKSMREPITVARTMSNDSFLKDALKSEGEKSKKEAVGEMKKYLSALKDGLGYDAAFVISDESKRYYSYDGLSQIVDPAADPHDAWYTKFLYDKKAYELDVDNDENDPGRWTVFVNARVEDGEKLLGVCGVGVQIENMQALFAKYEKDYNVKISLVDQNGIVQIDTDQNNIEKAFSQTDVISNEGQDDYVYHYKGRDEFAVTKYIENIGWYLVVSSNGSETGRRFIKVILINSLLCLLVLVIISVAMKLSMNRVNALHSASVIDSLTQMQNRRAYEEEKERLLEKGIPDDFICMAADVNGLKEVNDNLGHEAGDELIRGAADCLRRCFSNIGTVYRVGGDEFAGLFRAGEDELGEAKKQLEEVLAKWEGEKCGKLAISCGYASRKEFPEAGILELTNASDERMYEAKREYYKNHDRRRR